MKSKEKSTTILFLCFAMAGAIGFAKLHARAQYMAAPAPPPAEPSNVNSAAPNTANMNQNPVNNPAPGNPATNGPAFDPNSAPPTSTTLSIPTRSTAPKQNDRIAEEIRRQIQGKNASLFKAVTVVRERNTIILQGEVPTAADRTMVENTAKSVAKKLKVVNELSVHPTGTF